MYPSTLDWALVLLLSSLIAISATTRLRLAICLNSAESIKGALALSSHAPRLSQSPISKQANLLGNARVHSPSTSEKHTRHAGRWRRRSKPTKCSKLKERRRNKQAKSSVINVKVPIKWSQWRYHMEFAIGTPKVPVTAILDSGSDLLWTQCQPCMRCERQPTPIFDPRRSSSFSGLPSASPFCQALDHNPAITDWCDYYYEYGYGQTYTRGVLAKETLTFGTKSVAGVAFGCGKENGGNLSRTAGIAGLGQGRLSLVSQLKIKRFSYCLASANSGYSGRLLIGSRAKLNGRAGGVQSTPLLNDTTFYYLSLRGISIGATLLPIPSTVFEKMADSVYSGTTIDCGSTTTLLPKLAYDAVKDELESLVGLPVIYNAALSLSLCFRVSSWPPPRLPDMTFHFDGANMTLPEENYMYSDRSSGIYCFMMESAPEGMNFTNIGNFQQQNIHILHDLTGRRLSFVPAQCHKL